MTSWTERAAPPATSWTERSAPSSTILLEGPIKFYKRSDNFYEGARGRLAGEVPTKLTSNFFELSGASYPSSYFSGRRQDNFIESAPR